jgi:hypothetical protein
MKRGRKNNIPMKAAEEKQPKKSQDTTTPNTDTCKKQNITTTKQNTCTNNHSPQERSLDPRRKRGLAITPNQQKNTQSNNITQNGAEKGTQIQRSETSHTHTHTHTYMHQIHTNKHYQAITHASETT